MSPIKYALVIYLLSTLQQCTQCLESQACLNQEIQLLCAADHTIVVEEAVYGKVQGTNCSTNGESNTSKCMATNTKITLQSLCTNTNQCSFNVTQENFPKECPGDGTNALLVIFTCVPDNPTTSYTTVPKAEKSTQAYSSGLSVTTKRRGWGRHVTSSIRTSSTASTLDKTKHISSTSFDAPSSSSTTTSMVSLIQTTTTIPPHKSSIPSVSSTTKPPTTAFKSTMHSKLTTPVTNLNPSASTTDHPSFVKPAGTIANGTTASACVGETLILSCDQTSNLVIKAAIYGVFSGSICQPEGTQVMEPCLSQSILIQINEQCSGRRQCSVPVTPNLGSFCNQSNSALSIDYFCFSTKDEVDICSSIELLQPNHGLVTSPGYPQPYGSVSSQCIKTLNPGRSSVVKVTVHDIHMQVDVTNIQNCLDYFVIEDINTGKIYKYCGDINTYWLVLEVEIESMKLSFVTSANTTSNYRGFQLEYEVIQKKVSTTSVSPSTLQSSTRQDTCITQGLQTKCITVCGRGQEPLSCSVGENLLVTNATYGSVSSGMSQCLPINGNVSCDPTDVTSLIIAGGCGNKQGCIVDTQDTNIDTCSQSSTVSTQIQYQCLSSNIFYDICGTQDLSSEKGYVYSPNYPETYGKNEDCIKQLDPGPDKYVVVKIYDLHLQPRPSSGCSDFLVVEETGNPAKKFYLCGDLFTNTPVHNLTMLTLTFKADAFNRNHRGFMVGYEVFDIQQPAEDVFSTTSSLRTEIPTTTAQASTTTMLLSTVTQKTDTFDFPCNPVKTGGVCGVQCTRTNTFVMTCQKADTAINIEKATYEYNNIQLLTNCSSSLPPADNSVTCDPYDITTSIAKLCQGKQICTLPLQTEYSTCSFPANIPIKIEYSCSKVTDICSTDKLPDEGFLSTPMYPSYYPNNLRCTRNLIPSILEAYIKVELLDVDLEQRPGDTGCFDKLELKDMKVAASNSEICGNTLNFQTVYNFTQGLEANLVTDGFNTAMRGFILFYKVVSLNDVPVFLIDDKSTTSTTTSTTTSIISPTYSTSTTTTQQPTTTTPLISPNTTTHTVSLCRGEMFSTHCTNQDEVIVIEEASYGLFMDNQCGGNAKAAGVCDTNVLLKVVSQCSGFQNCTVTFKEVDLPTECSTYASLHVQYSCYPAPMDICDQNEILALPEGLIASRNYPSKYSYNKRQKDCFREIVPYLSSAYIVTRIYDIELERRTTSGCYDWLYLEEPNNPMRYYDYCGNMLDARHPLQNKFSKLNMTFKPNAVNHLKGFLLYYKVIGDVIPTTTPIPTTIQKVDTTPTTTVTTTPSTTTTTLKSSTSSAATTTTMATTPSTTTTTPKSSTSSAATTTTMTISSNLTTTKTTSTATSSSKKITNLTTSLPTSSTMKTTTQQSWTHSDEVSQSSSTAKKNSEPSKSEDRNNGALIAGIILAVLLLVFLVVLVFIAYLRRHRQSPAKVLKPGQRDLDANTKGAHLNAMNEYTYMNMNPTDSYVPLTAHESALSTPLYDSNRNRNFSTPQSGEKIAVVDDQPARQNNPLHNGYAKKSSITSELYPVDLEKTTSLISHPKSNGTVDLNGPSYPPPPLPEGDEDAIQEGEIKINMLSRLPDKNSKVTMQDSKPTTYETFSDA